MKNSSRSSGIAAVKVSASQGLGFYILQQQFFTLPFIPQWLLLLIIAIEATFICERDSGCDSAALPLPQQQADSELAFLKPIWSVLAARNCQKHASLVLHSALCQKR